MGLDHDEVRSSFLWDFLNSKNFLRTLTVPHRLLHPRDGVASLRILLLTPGSVTGSLASLPRTAGDENLLWGALIFGKFGTGDVCDRDLPGGLGGRIRASRRTGGPGSARI